MKNKIHIHSILVLFLSVCFATMQAQVLHELVLTVDTTKPNSTANQSFTTRSNTTIAENTSANRFTIWADVGDSVLWEAKTANESEVPISIVSVNYISGPRIFSSNTLSGKNIVKATIIRGGKEEYVYKLLYTIGSESKLYNITAAIKTKM